MSIDGVSGDYSTAFNAPATPATAGEQSLDKNAFLKLLVAQLKYQDPSKPTDATAFMAQTAQFTLVEKFEDLAKSNSSLLATTRTQSAVALVGRVVSWTADDGTTSTGAVTGVSVRSGEPVLEIGGKELSLDAVTRVQAGGTPATP